MHVSESTLFARQTLSAFGNIYILYSHNYISQKNEPQAVHIKRNIEIMETRVAVMAIIVEDTSAVEKLNAELHEYGKYIIGRMGLPYKAKNINIVSIALDAPQDAISALAGKLGNIKGLSVKTAYSNVTGND